MRAVFLFGTDISDKVISISDIEISTGDYGQLSVNDIPSIEGENSDGFWDQLQPNSPFYGARELSRFTISIYNDNVLTYEGFIQGITCNNQAKTATVSLKSYIQTRLEKGLIYASKGVPNPAIMVQEICSLYKIPIDGTSFGRASNIYELDQVRVSAFFRGEGTVQDGIQQILEIGVGRVYAQSGKLYFDVFRYKTVDPVFTATDKTASQVGITLYSHPTVSSVEKEPLKGYSIKYINGTAIFGTSDEQGKSIDGSYASPARIMTLQSAVWIGERWMDYFGLSQQTVRFSIPTRFGKSLQLTDPIKIEYRNTSYDVDIIAINKNAPVETQIGGITR